MSERGSPEARRGGQDLGEVLGAIFSRAYLKHMHGESGKFILPFENVELTSIKDPASNEQYIMGRPQLDSEGYKGMLFWLHEHVPQVPLQNYAGAELGLTVRQDDPSQFYILSEGEFIAFGTERSRYMKSVLQRSQPVPL